MLAARRTPRASVAGRRSVRTSVPQHSIGDRGGGGASDLPAMMEYISMEWQYEAIRKKLILQLASPTPAAYQCAVDSLVGFSRRYAAHADAASTSVAGDLQCR